jgi:hypothetical protein
MKKFDSMEQRVINMYIDLFPNYRPEKNNTINESSQNQFYNFIQSIFLKLYENPLLLFIKINSDDYFVRRFNKHSENKQSTYNTMKKIEKSLKDFSEFLFDIGKVGYFENELFIVKNSYKIPKRYISILEQCGLLYFKKDNKNILQHNEYKELFYCWKWFATKSGITLPHFISCMFDSNYSYTSEIYSKFAGSKDSFEKLVSFLLENNYYRIDNRDNKISLDYIKSYDKKDNQIKEPFGERTHGGISAQYDSLMKDPQLFSLRIPYYKQLLHQFEQMEKEERDFIVKTGKKCDNCGYCIQTDKTGKRELVFISVYNKQEYKMCPYFPAFQYCWEYLDQNIVNNIIGLLTFTDKILPKINNRKS